jgi:hypothetical protein
MKRYRTFTTAIALALMLSAPGAAHATDASKLAGCRTMAEFARTVANARDHGVPTERVRETIGRTFEDEHQMPADERDTINSLITMIYKNPNTSPDFLAESSLRGCMADPNESPAPGAAHVTDSNELAGCKSMAESMRIIAEARDRGVPLERVREKMEKDLPASARGNLDTAITVIYKNPNTPPDFFANASLKGCITPGSAMEGGIGK